MLNKRKYNIRGILKEVREREKEEKRTLNFLSKLSIEDMKSNDMVDNMLKDRCLYHED